MDAHPGTYALILQADHRRIVSTLYAERARSSKRDETPISAAESSWAEGVKREGTYREDRDAGSELPNST